MPHERISMKPSKTSEFPFRVATVSRSHYEPSKTEEKLNQLSKLEDGWYFGRGSGLSPQVVAKARGVLGLAESIGLKADVFPGKSGEITVAIYVEDVDHSFQVQNNLIVRYWNETDPDGDVVNLTDEQTYYAIFNLSSAASVWNSSSTCTLDTGIKLESTFEAKPSRTLAMAAESPIDVLSF